MTSAIQLAEAIREHADYRADRATETLAHRSVAYLEVSVPMLSALAAATRPGFVADALDMVRSETESIEPIDLEGAQELVSDSMGSDGALESLWDDLQCASDCESVADAIANLRQAAETARTLAATCAELAARLEAGSGGE